MQFDKAHSIKMGGSCKWSVTLAKAYPGFTPEKMGKSTIVSANHATSERVFSHINDIWTPQKGNMKIASVRAQLMTKFNWKYTCLEFFDRAFPSHGAGGAAPRSASS